MKKIIIILSLILPLVGFSQYLEKIEPNNLIGVKIKFLKDHDNKSGYRNFSTTPKTFYPYLNYEKYVGKTGTIVSVIDEDLDGTYPKRIFEIKLDNDDVSVKKKKKKNKSKSLYLEFGSSINTMENNIGIVSLLERGKELYVGKKFYFNQNEVKITNIDFSEETEKYSQLYGPVKVTYIEGGITKKWEGHLTTTYTTEELTYDHEKETIFENVFKIENPVQEITFENIEDKFHLLKDEFENTTTYYHKNLFNKYYCISSYLVKDDNTGKINLVLKSKLVDSDWYFHEYIKVKILDEVLTSSLDNDGSNRSVNKGTKYTDSSIEEINIYYQDQDINIIRLISENWKSGDISVRYVGKEKIKDFPKLNRNNQVLNDQSILLGIRDTYKLYLLLNTN